MSQVSLKISACNLIPHSVTFILKISYIPAYIPVFWQASNLFSMSVKMSLVSVTLYSGVKCH